MTRGIVLLAAGGTGGHLFPAEALAAELTRRDWEIHLATDERVADYGRNFPAREVHRISAATLSGRSPGAVVATGAKLARGVVQALGLIGRLKPKVVVGFGGYPSFPPLMAARLKGVPSALHEQNAVLGRANRMLAKRVSAIATSFPSVKHLDGALAAKAVMTGNPVRDKVRDAANMPYPELSATGPVRLLVFGGSQGARFFSEALPPALAQLPEAWLARLEVTQQCRPEDLDPVTRAYAALKLKADLKPFFPDLPDAMAKSHLVIGRAGASTVAELTVIGRPAILVPLPHALDNDQLNNALRLAEAGAAWCIEQRLATPERLAEELLRHLEEPGALAAAAAATRGLGRPDAALKLADLVERLAAGAQGSAGGSSGNG